VTLTFPIEIVPVMWVFWVWAALSIAYFMYGARRSSIATPPSDSPYISERSTHARRAELARQRFSARGWAYMLFANAIAGALLYLTTSGTFWAAIFLAIACLWLTYDHLVSPNALRDIASGQIAAIDRTYYATGVVVWVYVLACVIFPSGKLIALPF
jgi:hypothetical protein